MASPRSSSPGRTPPFVLVGLMVLVVFLAYNYWSLSSQNSELISELDTIRIQHRQLNTDHKKSSGDLASTKTELNKAKLSVENFRAQANQWLKERQALNAELKGKKDSAEANAQAVTKCQGDLKTANEGKAASETAAQTLKGEMEKLKAAPKTCDKKDCVGPVKEAVVVAAKLTGSEALGNALAKAGLDAAGLMEGIKLPAPAAAAPGDKAEPAKDDEKVNPEVIKDEGDEEVVGEEAEADAEEGAEEAEAPAEAQAAPAVNAAAAAAQDEADDEGAAEGEDAAADSEGAVAEEAKEDAMHIEKREAIEENASGQKAVPAAADNLPKAVESAGKVAEAANPKV